MQLQVLTCFLKLVYYRDYLGEIWRNSKIHDCQPILENYRHWLLNSFSYTAAKFWNTLPDKLSTLSALHDFILAVRQYRLIN